MYEIFFLIVLFKLAMDDLEKHLVSDILISLLWVLFAMEATLNGQNMIVYSILSFAFLYFLNSIYVKFTRKDPIFSWGDILLIPPCIGMLHNVSDIFLFLFPLFLSFVSMQIRKESFPAVPSIAVGYWIVLFYSFMRVLP